MKILKAYKTELDPNNKQAGFFRQCCGAARFVYNYGLAERIRLYEAGEKVSVMTIKKQFNAEKDALCPWIRELPYAVMEAAFADLDTAFKNFFRRLKNGDKEKGFPKFKKRGNKSSFSVRNIVVDNRRVKIQKIGWVRLKEGGYIPLEDGVEKYAVYATISERAGRWFISVQVEEEVDDIVPSNDGVIGIDFGVKTLAVCSDGTVYESSKPLREALAKLARLNRELSRRKKGGANWKKTQLKIQRAHAKVANIRKTLLHQISHDIIVNKHPRAVVIEDLNVSGMVKNHCLALSISDVGFAELRRQIEYKAAWHGVTVVVADRFFPSSKTCNSCGNIKSDLTLSDRTYICECGYSNDRDLNAAMNLADYGRMRL